MNDDVKHPAVKAVSGLGAALAAMSWGERAQMAACFYTLCLITEWVWKRVLKPFAQRRGWIGGRPSEFLDSTGSAPLEK